MTTGECWKSACMHDSWVCPCSCEFLCCDQREQCLCLEHIRCQQVCCTLSTLTSFNLVTVICKCSYRQLTGTSVKETMAMPPSGIQQRLQKLFLEQQEWSKPTPQQDSGAYSRDFRSEESCHSENRLSIKRPCTLNSYSEHCFQRPRSDKRMSAADLSVSLFTENVAPQPNPSPC
jgi:hypothetical protein